jgi:hypothetical protein
MNLENLNENRVEIALKMLSSSDEDHANLSGQVKYLEEAIKHAKARVFLQADGTVAERQERALDSVLYSDLSWTRTRLDINAYALVFAEGDSFFRMSMDRVCSKTSQTNSETVV